MLRLDRDRQRYVPWPGNQISHHSWRQVQIVRVDVREPSPILSFQYQQDLWITDIIISCWFSNTIDNWFSSICCWKYEDMVKSAGMCFERPGLFRYFQTKFTLVPHPHSSRAWKNKMHWSTLCDVTHLCWFQTNLPLWWWYLFNCASATCRRGMTKRQAASSQ